MITEFKRGMVVELRNSKLTIVFADPDGDALTMSEGWIYSEDLCCCTLLPESIYEGQKWRLKSQGWNPDVTVCAVSGSHIAYTYPSTACYGETRERFLELYIPLPEAQEITIEERFVCNGKDVTHEISDETKLNLRRK